MTIQKRLQVIEERYAAIEPPEVKSEIVTITVTENGTYDLDNPPNYKRSELFSKYPNLVILVREWYELVQRLVREGEIEDLELNPRFSFIDLDSSVIAMMTIPPEILKQYKR
jgi:hypothetical protein